MTLRKIFILLTRLPDNGSKAMRLITRFPYTHASIGLDEDMNTFYSFICKGFIVEKISRYLRPDREPFLCLLYELEVSEEIYQTVKEILNAFVDNKESMRYSYLGVALGVLHIPYKGRNRYFCSQFVAEVLKYSKAAYLKKDSGLYLPKDFQDLQGVKVKFQGDLHGMVKRFHVLSPLLV